MKSTRTLQLYLLLLACLLAVVGWSWWTIDTARGQALQAVRDSALCQEMAGRLVSLRQKPTIANTQEQAIQQLTGRIESQARTCGINQVAAIIPDHPGRMGDSDYLEEATTIQLRMVALTQVLDLASALSKEGGLRIKSIRFSTPSLNDTSDRWSVEMVVTYLIYSPQPRQSAKAEP